MALRRLDLAQINSGHGRPSIQAKHSPKPSTVYSLLRAGTVVTMGQTAYQLRQLSAEVVEGRASPKGISR
jgi:hypothetical protein